MKRFLLLFSVLFSSLLAQAQGEVPVDMYTGRPSVYVPLGSVGSHELSDGIGLSYDAGGVRVTQPSGNFGLGWNLNAGGAIVRQVRGLPDDWKGVSSDVRRGWFFKNTSGTSISYDVGNNISGLADTIVTTSLDSYETGVYSKLNGYSYNIDTEPDMFSYNFGNHSGHFVFDNSSYPPAIRVFPFDDIKITITQASDSSITGFTVVDNDGTSYAFTKLLNEQRATRRIATSVEFLKRDFSLFDSTRYHKTVSFTAEWDLTTVTSPLGATLTYGYAFMATDFTDTTRVTIQKGDGTGYIVKDIYSSHQVSGRWLLASLTGSTGSIATLSYNSNGMLSGVNLYDTRRLVPFIKETQLTYTTQDTADPKRYYLTMVRDSTGISYSSPYKFTYIDGHDTGRTLPVMTSRQVDFWGFFNGKSNTTFAPAIYYYPSRIHTDQIRLNPIVGISPTYTSGGADRNPDPLLVKTGTLSAIQYPAGGSTTFTYELNQYYDSLSGSKATNGGGLRVKTITYFDGINPSSLIRKTFVYQDSTGRSSGRLISPPVFAMPTAKYIDPLTNTYANKGSDWSYLMVRTDKDISDEETTHGSFIGYTEVRIYRAGSGWARYQYLVPGAYRNWTSPWAPTRNKFARSAATDTLGVVGSGGAWMFVNAPNPYFDHERGLTRLKREYAEGDTAHAVRTTSTTYQYLYKNGSSVVNTYGVRYDHLSNSGTNTFFYAKYTVPGEMAKTVLTETTKVVDAADTAKSQTTRTTYTFGSSYHRLVTKVEQTLPDGTIYSSHSKYPLDYGTVPSGADTTSAMINLLQTNFRNGSPVERWTTKKTGGTEILTGASVLRFNDFGTATKPLLKNSYGQTHTKAISGFTESFINGTSKVFTIDTGYLKTNTWLSYDSYGNPTSSVGLDRVPSSSIYGYSSTLPVISARNATATQFSYSDFDSGTTQEFTVTGTAYYGDGHGGYNAFYPGSKLTGYVTKANVTTYILSFWVKATSSFTLTVVLKNSSGTTINTYTPSIPSSSTFSYFTMNIPVTGVTTSSMSIELQATSLTVPPTGATWSFLNPLIDEVAFYPTGADVTGTSYNFPFGPDAVISGNQTIKTTYDDLGRQKLVFDTYGNIRKKTSYHLPSDAAQTSLSANFTFPSTLIYPTYYIGEGLNSFAADGNQVEANYFWKLNTGSYTQGTKVFLYSFGTAGSNTVYLKVKYPGFSPDSVIVSKGFTVVLTPGNASSCAAGGKSFNCSAVRQTTYTCSGVTDPGTQFTTFKITGLDFGETASSYQWKYRASGTTTWTNIATTTTYTRKFLPGDPAYDVMCTVTTNTGRIDNSAVMSVTMVCP